MRGPMVRLNLDVRRLWRCPQCGYERRLPADQTAVHCHCSDSKPFMQLVEERRAARPVPEILPPYFEYEEDDDITAEPEGLMEETTSIDSAESVSDDDSVPEREIPLNDDNDDVANVS